MAFVALTCAFLAGPWTGRDVVQHQVAGVLLALGVGLWFLNGLFHRARPAAPGAANP